VTVQTFLLLVLAGVAAGLTGSIAGIASLISYPALLATGLPPVTANVTNTVALVFQGIGSIHGSQPELRGQRHLVSRLLIAAIVGGIVGAVLLLMTPSAAFARIVPWLIGGASIAVLARPRPHPLTHAQAGDSIPLQVGVFVVGIYGGYFGAAAGVMLLALLLALAGLDLARASAVRSVVLSCANGVAALGFVVFGPVHWTAVVPLASGLLVGGRAGPVLIRHAPAGPLRVLIALTGLGLAIHLGLDAYT
jgi:uncharacterized membrane protein YfcA